MGSISKSLRPNYSFVNLGAALGADWRGAHLSRKADGICVTREWNGCRVWGDAMRDGRLFVWDIDRAFGEDVSGLPWRNGREAVLEELFAQLNPKLNWHRCATGHGVEFIEAMALAARREGTPDVIVAKPMDGAFGVGFTKVKLAETHDCVVLEVHQVKQSIRIGQFDAAGQLIERGWCAVRGGRVDQLNKGNVVEIVAGAITVAGKFREPRIVNDARTGRIKVRSDKTPAQCVS